MSAATTTATVHLNGLESSGTVLFHTHLFVYIHPALTMLMRALMQSQHHLIAADSRCIFQQMKLNYSLTSVTSVLYSHVILRNRFVHHSLSVSQSFSLFRFRFRFRSLVSAVCSPSHTYTHTHTHTHNSVFSVVLFFSSSVGNSYRSHHSLCTFLSSSLLSSSSCPSRCSFPLARQGRERHLSSLTYKLTTRKHFNKLITISHLTLIVLSSSSSSSLHHPSLCVVTLDNFHQRKQCDVSLEGKKIFIST